MADAYIGYRSAGRRPEQYNDRTASANAPLSAVRGYLAGTAGLPGDLEGLARAGMSQVSPELLRALPGARMFGLGARADQTPSMPTSEFYNEYLPGADLNQTPTGKLFTGAGNLMGGAYSTNLARAGIKGTEGLAAMAERVLTEAPRSGSRAAQKGVIKMKGGNWLAGSVEDSLKPLKQVNLPDPDLYFQQTGQRMPDAQINQTNALNNWVDKTLTKYVKNEMATPEDPVRALAEKGVLHVNPEQLNFNAQTHGRYMQPGQTAVAQSDAAKTWEGASDLKISPLEARNILDNYQGMGPLRKSRDGELFLQNNPGLLKVPPETLFNDIAQSGFAQDLGFDHLIDELRNATNPASGLPANLLLKPEALSRVTVPQAVERVAKINAWREAQKVEANQALANNAATQLVKEYPTVPGTQNANDKGLRWVELSNPETPTGLPEGWTLTPNSASEKTGLFRAVSPNGEPVLGQDMTDLVRNLYRRHPDAPGNPRQQLEQALKYEGDTMGHCVGGYCPDVLEGKSRIYSLRDAKGQPHVTIEVEPGRLSGKMNLEDWAARYEETHGQGSSAQYLAEHPEIEQAFVPQITQIKGKGNKKPNDEYLPFVQDFVKGGQWSDVGDLGNTGLRRIEDTSGVRFLTEQEFKDALENAPKPDLSGYADGGHVAYNPDHVDRIVRGFAEGGSVTAYDPSRVDAIVNEFM